jgi:hypothetical protein
MGISEETKLPEEMSHEAMDRSHTITNLGESLMSDHSDNEVEHDPHRKRKQRRYRTTFNHYPDVFTR